MQCYDIIGDIHGCSDELECLLLKLGYVELNGNYAHPEGGKVIFLGDFVDRGPNIRRVLQVVKAMCDNGTALAVLGNHEFNAVSYHTPTKDGKGFLRRHTLSNNGQHTATLDAFVNYPNEWRQYIQWFKSLPLFLKIDGLNIVHACWDTECLEFIASRYGDTPLLNDTFLHNSAVKSRLEYEAVEVLLKGREVELKDGRYFEDKEGHKRTEVRIKWWLGYEKLVEVSNFLDVSMSVPPDAYDTLQKMAFEVNSYRHQFSGLPQSGLTFIGHYWVTKDSEIMSSRLACMDYSCVQGGHLAAYRWSGETCLQPAHFVYVNSRL